MSIEICSKLIWQPCSPAPFESAWSVFAKLMALNGLKPSQLARLIAFDGYAPPITNSLRFRNSSWIDIDRFGAALEINPERLRLAFLDQLGFNIQETYESKNNGGIRFCSDCLKNGYHCVFFELGFIDVCPWHHKKLEVACFLCLQAILHSGLKNSKSAYRQVDQPAVSDWADWHSACKHILFNDGQVAKANTLTEVEERVIAQSCLDLLNWWKVVSAHAGISTFLARYVYGKSDAYLLNMYFNASEYIAGKCPRPVGQVKRPMRGLSWAQSRIDEDFEGDSAPRGTEWDIIYRSIRRHIFNRYVRPHRACWNELKNYSHIDSQSMNSDSVCYVALAYASWRLAIERIRNIEGLQIDRLRKNPILVMRLSELGFEGSIRAHASLLYVQFFCIWDEIIRVAGKESFAIDQVFYGGYKPYFGAMFAPDQNGIDSESGSGEWSVIFPDSRPLRIKSYTNCCGRLKKEGWMLYPGYPWEAYFNGLDTQSGNPIFRLKKYEGDHKSTRYQYISA